MEEWILSIAKEITPLGAVIAAFLGGMFYLLPRVFTYHENRLRELSEEYRRREEEQEARHRAETKEMLEKFCQAMDRITDRLGVVEQKIDRWVS